MFVAEAEKKLINNPNLFDIVRGQYKGRRGQELERRLGLRNGSTLIDFVDGELKSFTDEQSIKITVLNHCLEEIIDNKVEFKDSKVYKKIKTVIFVPFNKSANGGRFIGWKTIRMEDSENREMFEKILEDFEYITEEIRKRYNAGKELKTITGPNKTIQIRTADSKSKTTGEYRPLLFKGNQLYDKQMAFYYTARFGRDFIKKYF